MSAGMTDRNLPFLPAGLMGIGKGQSQCVEKDRCRLLNGHAVLPLIRLGFQRIPLIDYRSSLPQALGHEPRLVEVSTILVVLMITYISV